MAKFFELRKADGKLVWINIDNICAVVEHHEAETAIQMTGKEAEILTRTKYEDVKKLILANK